MKTLMIDGMGRLPLEHLKNLGALIKGFGLI
jgi:hypothetical protein